MLTLPLRSHGASLILAQAGAEVEPCNGLWEPSNFFSALLSWACPAPAGTRGELGALTTTLQQCSSSDLSQSVFRRKLARHEDVGCPGHLCTWVTQALLGCVVVFARLAASPSPLPPWVTLTSAVIPLTRTNGAQMCSRGSKRTRTLISGTLPSKSHLLTITYPTAPTESSEQDTEKRGSSEHFCYFIPLRFSSRISEQRKGCVLTGKQETTTTR